MSGDRTGVPFHRPFFDAAAEAAVLEALRSGWLTNGPRVRRFEAEFAAAQEVGHAIAVGSCTAALELALQTVDLAPGDEVITTPFTFAADCNAILRAGGTPVLADIDPETLNLSPQAAAAAITPRTRAIILVHYSGEPADITAFEAIRDRHRLTLIHDAAHALEAHYHGQSVASRGDLTCFSFYATKNLTIGEGGMVTTGNAIAAGRLRRLAMHGTAQGAWDRHGDASYVPYDVLEPGSNAKMTEMAAALGSWGLARVEAGWQRRDELVNRYDNTFRDLPGVRRPVGRPGRRSAHHLYVLLIGVDAPVDRDGLFAHLCRRGIGVGVHYWPIHRLSYYAQRFDWDASDFPSATAAGEQCLSLPLYPALTDDEQDRVIGAVREAFGYSVG
jgi:dTDP-4-amino-4,6-dideoxygalactose transaminase